MFTTSTTWEVPHRAHCCSVSKSCLTLCNPMDCSMPGLPVLHYLPEFARTHVHCVDDAIQPYHYHPLLFLSSVFPSIRVFSSESALCTWWPKYWSFSFSISPSKSGLISFRIDWFDFLAVQVILKSSPAPQFETISSAVNLLHGLSHIHT